MTDYRITVQITPSRAGDDVRWADFNKELQALSDAFERADVGMYGAGRRTLEYRVVDLHHSNPTVVLEAVPIEGVPDQRGAFLGRFFDGITQIVTTDRLPSDFGADVLDALRELAKPIGSTLRETNVTWGERSVTFGVGLKKKLFSVSAPDEREEGTWDGMIEEINVHGSSSRFRLYPVVGPEFLTCRFERQYLPVVREALGRYAVVSGEVIYRRGARYPHRIELSDIEILPSEDQPSFSDLEGIAPNATGDLSVGDFLRRLQDEW